MTCQRQPCPEADRQVENLPPILFTAAAIAITATLAAGAYHFSSFFASAVLP